jgi:pectate lyase
MKKTLEICLVLFPLFFGSIIAVSSADDRIKAFPGAEGFGMYSAGGRNGKVIEVTNLADSGPGSLRAAIDAWYPRIIVFRISGYIELKSFLKITNPYITIAGQTAPGDGICLKNYGIMVYTDNVIIRYLRIRPGISEGVSFDQMDSIWVAQGHNVIIDHCSASWAVDETLSVASSKNNISNVTVQWCIISESLNCSVHPKGCHGFGSLICGCCGNGVTYHHNLYAHHKGRNPFAGNYNDSTVDPIGFIFDFRNNVIYNWGDWAGHNGNGMNSITRMNFVGNYYKKGPNSASNYAFWERCRDGKAYFSGNWMEDSCPDDQWSLVRFRGRTPWTDDEKIAYKQSSPIPVEPVNTSDALTAYKSVLAGAGATFPVRDAVDERVVDSVINKTGRIIDSIEEVGGYPRLTSGKPPADSDHDGMPDKWELAVGLNPYDSNDGNLDRDSDGYTNIEEYINWLPQSKLKKLNNQKT